MGYCWPGEVVSTLWFDKTLRLWKQIYLFIFKYPPDFGSSGHGLLGHMPVTTDHKILWCFPLMCLTSPNFVESLSGSLLECMMFYSPYGFISHYYHFVKACFSFS